MPESTTKEPAMTIEEIRARRTTARNALVGKPAAAPADTRGIEIHVDRVPGHVAILLPTGDTVLIDHDAWRDAAARLPQPAPRQPRTLPAAITRI
jgi:hypothetical protein